MSKPSFTLTYWRPWEKSSSFIDSWLDYNKDVSLVGYGAEVIGSAINQLSQDQISSINSLSQSVNDGYSLIEQELHTINRAIGVTNYKLDTLIQTQVANHVVLKDIQELLKVPDREKERVHHIENALKYIKHVETNRDFYKDAYTEFKKAKALKAQDYFTLFNLGMIELYSPSHINVASAKKHFDNAIKYASIDKGNNEFDYLNSIFSKYYYQQSDFENATFSSFCYIQSAMCSYVLGDDIAAHNKIVEALTNCITEESNNEELYYYLAKFASRLEHSNNVHIGIDYCLKRDINLLSRMVNDFDFVTNQLINKYLTDFVERINLQFENLKRNYKGKSGFRIYKHINDALLDLDNSIESKYKFIESFCEEFINEEIDKEKENIQIDNEIKYYNNRYVTKREERQKLKLYESVLKTQKDEAEANIPYRKDSTLANFVALFAVLFIMILPIWHLYNFGISSFIRACLYPLFFFVVLGIFLAMRKAYYQSEYDTLSLKHQNILNQINTIDSEVYKINSKMKSLRSNKKELYDFNE